MNSFKKSLIFITIFSVFIILIHQSNFYNEKVLIDSLGGVPWLYSSLMILFSILSGFIIQRQLENWDNLVDSVKREVDSLRELFLWSRYLPEEYKQGLSRSIKYYIKEMIEGGLVRGEKGKKSGRIELAFTALQAVIFDMSQKDQKFISTTFSFFSRIMEARTNRLLYSFHSIPQILKNAFLFCTFLVITLCLFIGIENIWLDYIFTLSVSLMAYIIYIIVDDLDTPLVVGSWHLTTGDYDHLLKQIENIEATEAVTTNEA
ncbi:MAG: hypothetical protein WCK10_02075 [Candidatus Staskawiczbacteria bacterium]